MTIRNVEWVTNSTTGVNVATPAPPSPTPREIQARATRDERVQEQLNAIRRVQREDAADAAEAVQNEAANAGHGLRHRDQQPGLRPPQYTLPGGLRGTLDDFVPVAAERDQPRVKVSKRKKGASGPQYNRIRSASTL